MIYIRKHISFQKGRKYAKWGRKLKSWHTEGGGGEQAVQLGLFRKTKVEGEREKM